MPWGCLTRGLAGFKSSSAHFQHLAAECYVPWGCLTRGLAGFKSSIAHFQHLAASLHACRH